MPLQLPILSTLNSLIKLYPDGTRMDLAYVLSVIDIECGFADANPRVSQIHSYEIGRNTIIHHWTSMADYWDRYPSCISFTFCFLCCMNSWCCPTTRPTTHNNTNILPTDTPAKLGKIFTLYPLFKRQRFSKYFEDLLIIMFSFLFSHDNGDPVSCKFFSV